MKFFIQKYLVKITLIVAVVGFFMEMSGFFPDRYLGIALSPIAFFKQILPFTEFYFLPSLTTYNAFSSDSVANYFSVCFYLLLFTAGFLYYKNKGNYRLLIFLHSIILLINFCLLIITLYYTVKGGYCLYIILLLKSAIWSSYAFFVLKFLNNKTELKEGMFQGNELAPVSHRFINLFVDIGICYFLILGTPIGEVLILFVLRFIENGEGIAIYILYIIYCFIFETLFGATPAKYLTQSRLTTVSPVKLNVATILLRSVCRVIPFEAWSFLFAKTGWHDGLSNTRVIKTKPDTVKSLNLFIIILAVAVLSGLPFLINWGIESYTEREYYKNERVEKYNNLLSKTKILNENSGLFVEHKKKYKKEYLKVKSIDNGNIEAYLINSEMDLLKDLNQESLIQFINDNKNFLETVRFNINDLLDEIKDNGQTYRQIEDNEPFNIRDYKIFNILDFNEPMLDIHSNSTSMNNDILNRSISITNQGWDCYLVDIEIIKGIDDMLNAREALELPHKIKGVPHSSYKSRNESLSLHYQKNRKFKVKLHFKSVEGKEYVYEIEGVNFDCKINLLK